MCRPASFVVTKAKVFWGLRTESHEEIISENRLKEMSVRGTPTFVRVEIVPPKDDWTAPIRKWEYRLDQDLRPQWYDPADCERRTRAALKCWYKAKVVGENQTVTDISGSDTKCYVLGTVESVSGNGTVKYVSDNGTVKYVSGNGTVKYVHGNGTVEYVSDNGIVESVSGNGTVRSVVGNGTVEYVSCNGTVEYVSGNGTVKAVSSNGTVKSVSGNGTVRSVLGNGTVESVYGNGTVKAVFDNGTVKAVFDNGIVTSWNKLPQKVLQSPTAVLIVRDTTTVKCYTGMPK